MHDAQQENWTMVIGSAVISGVMAMLTRSTGHNDLLADVSWMFSVWFEALAWAPQVWLIFSTGSLQAIQTDESTAHFAGISLSASLAFAIFWGRCARDRAAEFMKDDQHLFFPSIVFAACIRLLLCGSYVYLYARGGRGKKGGYDYE